MHVARTRNRASRDSRDGRALVVRLGVVLAFALGGSLVVAPSAVAAGAAPEAYEDSVSVPAGEATTLLLTADDVDLESLTFAVASAPTDGTLGSMGTPICDEGYCEAEIDYTPGGEPGDSDSFTFTANDGTLTSAPAEIFITVASAPCGAVVSNGTVQLGINCVGDLNFPGPPSSGGVEVVGLRFVPTNNDSTSPGCACEGWGVADATSTVSGFANESEGQSDNLTVVSFTSDADSATSVVDVGSTFRITHDYQPSTKTPNLYTVVVTIKNLSAATTATRYRRVMDWDVEPTPFNEFVTLQRGNASELVFTSDDGFASADPLSGPSSISETGNFVDSGPDDHGALFDFDFGALAPGASKTFSTHYGAAATETGAISALAAVGAESYSFGQPDTESGPTLGTPNTFVFAFSSVGGGTLFTPNAVDDSLTTPKDTAGSVNVLSNDTDPNGDTLTVTTLSPSAAHGTVACTAAGVCTYTPTAGYSGADSFSYSISDGNGGTDAATVSVTVTAPPVDDTPPQTTITAGPAGLTNDSTPTFSFVSSEADSTFECRVDTGTFAACTSPHTTATLGDGPHTFEVRATDPAGNTDPTPATRSFTVDTTPPDTSITAGPTGPTNDSTATFSFTSTETAFECRIDGAPFVACTSPFTTAALSDGAHTFEVRAVDPAGNVDPSPASRSFTVDTTPPDTTITAGPSGTTNDSTPSFSFTSESGATFECRVDAGSWSSCTSPTTTSALPDGVHTFEVRASDALGNTDATPASRSFTVDTTPPDTTITAGPSGVTSDTTPSFSFTATEAGSSFECRVDAAAFAPCTSPLTTGALSLGAHTFEVRATDAAGNTDATPASRAFTVDTSDTTPPDTTITAGPTGTTNDSTPTFSFTATEAGSTFECRVDAGAFAPCTTPHTTAVLGEGPHTFEVRATDPVGNTDATPASRSFTVDTTAPDTVITSGPSGTTTDSTPTIAFSGSGGAVAFECRVDSGAWVTCTSPYTTATLGNGSHTFEVRAVDGVGNIDPTPASLTFTVAPVTTPPVPPTYTCGGKAATIVGTPGADVLSGTGGNDVIVGLGGNDKIAGGGGKDLICGGDGNDKIEGAAGNDDLDGGEGNDRLVGGGGADQISGGDGDDRLLGNGGADTLDGGAGDDDLAGAAGDDVLKGAGGRDTLEGDGGDDVLKGGAGDDKLDGGAGKDRGDGGGGDDVVLRCEE